MVFLVMCAFTQKNTVSTTNYLMNFPGQIPMQEFSQPDGTYRKKIFHLKFQGEIQVKKGSNLVRCEKVAAHRERILFQLYFSTALRNVGRKSFSNRNFPVSGIVTRVLFLKILGQRVFSHVRIYTENTFLFNQYFHNFLGKFRCRNFSTRKDGNPCPPLIQKKFLYQSSSVLFTGLP